MITPYFSLSCFDRPKKKKKKKQIFRKNISFSFFFRCAHGMQQFLGQGSNLSNSNDNASSLTLGHQGIPLDI